MRIFCTAIVSLVTRTCRDRREAQDAGAGRRGTTSGSRTWDPSGSVRPAAAPSSTTSSSSRFEPHIHPAPTPRARVDGAAHHLDRRVLGDAEGRRDADVHHVPTALHRRSEPLRSCSCGVDPFGLDQRGAELVDALVLLDHPLPGVLAPAIEDDHEGVTPRLRLPLRDGAG